MHNPEATISLAETAFGFSDCTLGRPDSYSILRILDASTKRVVLGRDTVRWAGGVGNVKCRVVSDDVSPRQRGMDRGRR